MLTAAHRYFFDVNGYVVLPGALTGESRDAFRRGPF